jgi:Protein of unknown function (DUF1360)
MRQEGMFKWLTLDMLVFAAVNFFLLPYCGDRLTILDNIGALKLLVFGLAAYRAANVLSNEAVTKPLRAPFVEESEKDGKVVEKPKNSGFKGAMGHLIYCPSCTGLWLSAALVYSYVFFPGPTFLVALFLALSAIERIVSALLARLKAT